MWQALHEECGPDDCTECTVLDEVEFDAEVLSTLEWMAEHQGVSVQAVIHHAVMLGALEILGPEVFTA